MSHKISVQNISKSFGGQAGKPVTQALHQISLDIHDGEFLTLVGPSGSGKTTLLDLLAGLNQPSSGAILIDGKPITGPGKDRAVVFQQYALFPWRTAGANVSIGLEGSGLSKRQRRATAEEYLELVGLAGSHDRYPDELSGGMKQRVAIARALAYQPDILLMDEPFAALDAQTREQLQDELLRIWRTTAKTIVFITHGVDEAVYLGQRVAVLSAHPGRLHSLIDIDLPARGDASLDIRSDPAFAALRHEVWTALHSENRHSDNTSRKVA